MRGTPSIMIQWPGIALIPVNFADHLGHTLAAHDPVKL
jgi:hypothetical protein